MRLRIESQRDRQGVVFGVPRVTNAETGEEVRGVTGVEYMADQEAFPDVVLRISAHEVDLDVEAYEVTDPGEDDEQEIPPATSDGPTMIKRGDSILMMDRSNQVVEGDES